MLQLLNIVVHSRHNGDNQNLTRTDPEWPLAAKVLNQYTQEALKATNDSSVDDDGARPTWTRLVGLGLAFLLGLFHNSLALLVGHVLELEVDWCLVVQLDSSTLELSLESISNGDVDLRTIECTIAFVNRPVFTLELGHRRLELLLGIVPGLEFAEILLWASGKLQLECKAEQPVDGLEEIKETLDLGGNLRPVS